MPSKATADRYSSGFGLVGSLALHLAIVVAMLVTWSSALNIVNQSTPVVPVELVTVADKTNVAPTVTERAPPVPNMVEPVPPPEAQAPNIEIASAEKPKPAPKKEKFDINNVAQLVNKLKPASQPNAKLGPQNIKGVGAQSAMTADLTAILKSEIYRCWTPPTGGPHPEKLVVVYELYLNKDGTVAQAPQLDAHSAAAASGDPYMLAAADAAKRAIYACQPYKLPADRYNVWHDVKFTFDPAPMLGY